MTIGGDEIINGRLFFFVCCDFEFYFNSVEIRKRINLYLALTLNTLTHAHTHISWLITNRYTSYIILYLTSLLPPRRKNNRIPFPFWANTQDMEISRFLNLIVSLNLYKGKYIGVPFVYKICLFCLLVCCKKRDQLKTKLNSIIRKKFKEIWINNRSIQRA